MDHAITGVLESIPDSCLERIGKVLIIDNGSTDHTVEEVLKFILRRQDERFELYQNEKNYFLGGSTILAFSMAIAEGYDFLICMHGDGQASSADLLKLIDYSQEDVDLVLGSRLMEGSQVSHYSVARLWGNRFFAWLQSFIVRRQLGDIGSFISFNLKMISKLPYDTLPFDMSYQPLLILVALKKFPDLVIREIPIYWGEAKRSNVNVMGYSLTHAWRLLLIFLRVPLRSAKDMRYFKAERRYI